MTNKYFRCSKLPEWKFRQVLKCYARGETATRTSGRCNLSLRTVTAIFSRIRQRLVELSDLEQSRFRGSVQVDTHYFRVTKKWGLRRDGQARPTFLGFMDEHLRVFTVCISNKSQATLHPLIQEHVESGARIVSDGWSGFRGLAAIGYPDHAVVKSCHRTGRWAMSHGVNITGFWWSFQARIWKLRGLHQKAFLRHLKEWEFRWNHQGRDLYRLLMEILRKRPL